MTVLPLPERVPTVAFPLVMLSTIQVTAVTVVPETVAVRVMVPALYRLKGPEGDRVTLSAATAWTVALTEALLVGSCTLVATRVWAPAVAGAA